MGFFKWISRQSNIKSEKESCVTFGHSLKESGNVFLMLFGAIGMVGIIGASTMTVMKGPVSTMSQVTKRTLAENNMIAAGKLALISAVQNAGGDCDTDGTIEPVPMSATAIPGFTGGSEIPSTIGTSKNDSWGMPFGYCAWDHGTGDCGGNHRTGGATSTEDEYVIAIISAGPDGVFNTSCNDYVDSDTNNEPDTPLVQKMPGSDDLFLGYTYNEAALASGGLWNLDSGDLNTAEIAKNVTIKDSGGTTQFAFDAASGIGDIPSVKTDFLNTLNNSDIDVLAPIDAKAAITSTGAISGASLAASGAVTGGSLDVGSGAISGGAITGSSVDAGSGAISGGAITGSSVDAGSGAIDGGSLDVSGSIDGGSLDVGTGAITGGAASVGSLSAGGLIQTTGDLDADGTATLGTLSVTGNATVTGTLGVTAGTSLSTLGTSGLATLDSLSVTNATNLSTLGTSGLATLNSLSVTNNVSVGGELDMNTTNKIVNLAGPSNALDAANKAYVDAQVAAGTGFTENDPTIDQAGSITGRYCMWDGSQIVCTGTVADDDTLAGLSCTSGQVAKFDGTNWACAADDGSGGGGGSGGGWTSVNQEVFNGSITGTATSATGWTDLDLSSHVGTQETLVYLEVKPLSGSTNSFSVRPNGVTGMQGSTVGSGSGAGASSFQSVGVASPHGFIVTTTDENGVIEMTSYATQNWQVNLIGFAGGGGSGGSGATEISFHAHRNNIDQTGATNYEVIDFTDTSHNTGNAFDTTTNRFQPSEAGRYMVGLAVACQHTTPQCEATIRKNGTNVSTDLSQITNYPYTSTTTIVEMNGTTDYIEFIGRATSTGTLLGYPTATYAYGHLLGGGSGGSGSGGGEEIFITCTNENTDGDGTDDKPECIEAATTGSGTNVIGSSNYIPLSCNTGANAYRVSNYFQWNGTNWLHFNESSYIPCEDGTLIIANLNATEGGGSGGSGSGSGGSGGGTAMQWHSFSGVYSEVDGFGTKAVYPTVHDGPVVTINDLPDPALVEIDCQSNTISYASNLLTYCNVNGVSESVVGFTTGYDYKNDTKLVRVTGGSMTIQARGTALGTPAGGAANTDYSRITVRNVFSLEGDVGGSGGSGSGNTIVDMTDNVLSAGTLPTGTVVPASGSYNLGSMAVTPGIYIWEVYNCATQMNYSVGQGNTISIVGTPVHYTTTTWSDLAARPSGGSCGTIYTGVMKATSSGNVSVQLDSYAGSQLNNPIASAFGVTMTKILNSDGSAGGSGSGGSGSGGTDVVAVEAYRTDPLTLTTSTSIMPYNDEREDTHTAYDSSTGIFTAPRDGYYLVNAGWYSTSIPVGTCGYIGIFKEGTQQISDLFCNTDTNVAAQSVSTSGVVQLDSGETLSVSGYTNGSTIALTSVTQPWQYLTITSVDGGGSGSGGSGTGTAGGEGFRATFSSNQSIPNGGVATDVDFDTEVRDDLDGFDPTTGVFTAPEDGWYQLSTDIQWENPAESVMTGAQITVNGTYACRDFGTGSANDKAQNCSTAVYMSAGQTAKVVAWQWDTGNHNIEYGVFSGVAIGSGGSGASGSGGTDADFGDPESRSVATDYTETTAGIVTASGHRGSAGACQISGIVDGTNIGVDGGTYNTGNGAFISFPVKAGTTWRVNQSTSGYNCDNLTINFTPLVGGGSGTGDSGSGSAGLDIETVSSFNTNLTADADGFITFSAIDNSPSAVCRLQGIVNGTPIAYERSETSSYDYLSLTFPVKSGDTYQLEHTTSSCGSVVARYAKLTGGGSGSSGGGGSSGEWLTVSATAPVTTSVDSWADVPDLSTTLDAQGGKAFIHAVLPVYNDTVSAVSDFRLTVDGTPVTTNVLQFTGGTDNIQNATLSAVVDLVAGSQTIAAQWKTRSGTLTASWGSADRSLSILEHSGGGSGASGSGAQSQTIAFHANVDGTQVLPTGGSYVDIEFATQAQDIGGDNFNPATGKFTAPEDGFYQFNATVAISASGTDQIMAIQKESGTLESGANLICIDRENKTVAGNEGLIGCSGAVYLNANDVVEVVGYHNSAGNQQVGRGSFSGFKIGADASGSGSGTEVAFSVHKNNVDQTNVSSNTTVVTWPTEVFDTNNDFDSNRFTPSVAGKYQINAQTRCGTTTSICLTVLMKNGTEVVARGGTISGVNSSEYGGPINAVVDMNGTTDYLEVRNFNDGTETVSGQLGDTYFSGFLIGGGSGGSGSSGDGSGASETSFAASDASGSTAPSGTWADIVFTNQDHENGGDNYNPTNGKFTAPEDGTYHFNAAIIDSVAANGGLMMAIVREGDNKEICRTSSGDTAIDSMPACSGLISLSANDVIVVRGQTRNGSAVTLWNGSTFSGYKINSGGSGSGSGGSGDPAFVFCSNENTDGDGTDDIAACVGSTDVTSTDYRALNCQYTGINDRAYSGDFIKWDGAKWIFRAHTGTEFDCLDGTVLVADATATGGGTADNLGDHAATQGIVFHKVTGAAAPTK
jgi:hypothetical protein